MDDLFSKTLLEIALTPARSGGWVYGVFGAADARYGIGIPEGLAPLGTDNLVPPEHLPPPAFVPTHIAAGEVFRVPANKQALYALPIVVDGSLVIDGTLVEVV